MRCPYCGSLDDKVIESRTMASGESIRRRRECVTCGYRFTSYERIEEKPFMVVKRDGRRQPVAVRSGSGEGFLTRGRTYALPLFFVFSLHRFTLHA